MPRTANMYYADTPHSGGVLWCPAWEIGVLSTTTVPALTRTAEGDFALNRTAGGAETVRFIASPSLNSLSRLLEAENFQEQFGGTVGPVPARGFPPYTGASQLTAPTTSGTPKGIQITDVFVVYQVTVATLTSAAITLDKIVYANNVANAVTSVPLNAVALPTAIQANPFVTTIPVTTPSFNVTDLSALIAEVDIVLQNNGVLNFMGIGFHVKFNYD